jgi:cytochrome c553
MPGLLGLPHDYVVAQFGSWRTGQRRAADPDCMGEITQRLTLEDIGAIGAWLAARQMPADSRPAASIKLPLPMRCGSGIEGAAR